MRYNDNLSIYIFYSTLFIGCYFLLAFTGFYKSTECVLIGVMFEMLTIPLMLLLSSVLVFSIYCLIFKKIRPNFYLISSVLVSCIVIVAMLFIK